MFLYATYCKYSMDDLETVSVNGLKMYRVGKKLFLTKGEAIYYIKYYERCPDTNTGNYKALSYGSINDSDPIEIVKEFGTIKGIII